MPMNFVVGKERSGTTLLQVMLNSNPQIVAPPESRFIVLLNTKYGSIKYWTEKNIRDFCNDLFREMLFKNHWVLDKNKLQDSLLSVKDSLTYPLVCKLLFLLNAGPGKEAVMLFDKNPIYYYFLPTLEKIFPDAKFIHLVRDYRANIASHQRVFKIKKAGDLAYRWVKINELAEDSKRRKPGKYFTLKYESLVTDPEAAMKGICSFLGIPFSDKMSKDHTESLYPTFKENKKPRFLEMHGNLLSPISSVHVDEWRKKLSDDEVAEAEAVAGEYGAANYSYPIVSGKPVKLNMLKLCFIKAKYSLIKITYHIVFSNLSLYYFVRRRIWRNF